MNDLPLPGKAGTNRHPVDQLGQIRATIKTLQEREDQLKAEISDLMGSADSLGGDEYIARQTVTERKGAIDEAALKKIGVDVDLFRKPRISVFSIKVEARAMEAA